MRFKHVAATLASRFATRAPIVTRQKAKTELPGNLKYILTRQREDQECGIGTFRGLPSRRVWSRLIRPRSTCDVEEAWEEASGVNGAPTLLSACELLWRDHGKSGGPQSDVPDSCDL